MADLRPVIAKNITDLRKSMSWTQMELAQKLNYSDKAISKWERAESVPDVSVLKQIADLFEVTTDYLLTAEHTKAEDMGRSVPKHRNRNRLIIALLSASLVFLIATIVYVVLELYPANTGHHSWMVYIYALPVACVVLLVFNSIWGRWKTNFILISSIVWSILLAVYLSFLSRDIWLIFMIGIPMQIIILLWANFKLKAK